MLGRWRLTVKCDYRVGNSSQLLLPPLPFLTGPFETVVKSEIGDPQVISVKLWTLSSMKLVAHMS